MFAGCGNDTIEGGNEVISAHFGNDMLNDGAGSDTISGVSADTFAFAGPELSSGVDVITGFNQILDMLQISGLSDTSAVQLFVNSATEALVFFNGFEAITVQSTG